MLATYYLNSQHMKMQMVLVQTTLAVCGKLKS